jgi:ABC-type antimicrobial peptide transport system permease subunit
MLSSYFKIAFRNLVRHRRHTFLNITGLAISIAVCLVIFLVVKHETSYNKYLTKYQSLYHLTTKEIGDESETFTSGVSFPSIQFLRKDYARYRFGEMMHFTGTQVSVRPGKHNTSLQKFYETVPACFLDSVMADFLDLKIIAGDAGLFSNHDKVAISRETAEKYFGDYKAAVGNVLNINTQLPDITIGAVFENIPETSDFPFFLVGSYEYFKKNNPDGWEIDRWNNLSSNHQVYACIPDAVQTASFRDYLENFYYTYHPDGKESNREMVMRPVSAIHFDESIESNGDHITSWSSIYTLALVGVLILLMACINFINLSTALAFSRSKEIGVRKVLGSNKNNIRWQLFTETGIIVFLAIFLGVGLCRLGIPYVKHLMVVQSDLSLFTADTLLFLLCLGLATVVLAGAYPAFIFSRFSPLSAIKNSRMTPGKFSIITRKSLVVIQFAFTQVLFIATLVTIQQMQYVKMADMGFDKEAVLNLNIANDSVNAAKIPAFKQALLSMAEVQSVSFAFDAPSSGNSWSTNFAFDIMEDQPFEVQLKFAEPEYVRTFGLQLVAGTVYPETDTVQSYVVNEAFTRKVGLKSPEEALGKMLRLGGGKPKPVIGVMRDFKQESLRTEVTPIVMRPYKRYYSLAAIKLNSRNLQQSREVIKVTWDKFFPDIVFQSGFYDEDIEQYYQQDIRLSRMYRFCALLAIIISCLGLYGLISFIVAQKTKEVGVRKVLGAGVVQIVFLFSRDFILLVCIAFLIAAPVAYLFMQQWLQSFVYRITMSPMIFVSAILASLVTAFLAVGYKSYRAAVLNPVHSLRNE